MKHIFLLFIAAASAFGADGGLRVFTSSATNAEGRVVYTKDVFTRGGETNLIHVKKIGSSQEAHTVFQFYRSGQLVAQYIMESTGRFLSTESSAYTFSLEFEPGNQVGSAKIGDKLGLPLEEYIYANGAFRPTAEPPARNRLIRPVLRTTSVRNDGE
jgi:hypothetical protein